ncbi:MAG: heavy-metal-associated domain-containing protein [Gemmatimonadaceae bacterium]|nr:heavy-metal-associated domain-containing protein [Gemmatimonadaceae bacterium]
MQLKIGGLSCSFCVASITKAMHRMDGVREANVNLAHEEAPHRVRVARPSGHLTGGARPRRAAAAP